MQPSNESAEWDYTHAAVLNIKNEHSPEPMSTGIPRRPDSRTRWLRVMVDYPDDYLPEFPELLGPGVYDLNGDGTLRKYYPLADFSVEQVRALLLDRVSDMTRLGLMDTDGYLLREIETKKPMPPEMKAARDALRGEAAALKETIRTGQPTDLLDLDLSTRLSPVRPRRNWTPPQDRESDSFRFEPRPERRRFLGPGQPGDAPSSLRPGEEPAVLDPALTEPPDPSIDGTPIDEMPEDQR